MVVYKLVFWKGFWEGNDDVECLTESEICKAVIFLMDSEVTLCYDGREFTAFELF